jgi:hypothetical protein
MLTLMEVIREKMGLIDIDPIPDCDCVYLIDEEFYACGRYGVYRLAYKTWVKMELQ